MPSSQQRRQDREPPGHADSSEYSIWDVTDRCHREQPDGCCPRSPRRARCAGCSRPAAMSSQRAHGLLDRHLRVPQRRPVDVDVVGAQPAQRVRQPVLHRHQPTRRTARPGTRRPVSERAPNLTLITPPPPGGAPAAPGRSAFRCGPTRRSRAVSTRFTPASSAACSVATLSASSAGPYRSDMPIAPSPMIDTSGPEAPNRRRRRPVMSLVSFGRRRGASWRPGTAVYAVSI